MSSISQTAIVLGVANQFDGHSRLYGQGGRNCDPAVEFSQPFASKFCHFFLVYDRLKRYLPYRSKLTVCAGRGWSRIP